MAQPDAPVFGRFCDTPNVAVHRIPFQWTELEDKAYHTLKVMLSQVPTKKQARVTDTMPNKPYKRKWLLAKHAPGWTDGCSAQKETE